MVGEGEPCGGDVPQGLIQVKVCIVQRKVDGLVALVDGSLGVRSGFLFLLGGKLCRELGGKRLL